MGVEELYDLFEHGFPSPAVAPIPTVYTAAGEPFGTLTCDPDGPLVAEVVRTTSDQFIGRVSLVRVFSGTLRPDTPLHVSGHLQRFTAHPTDGHADHDVDGERPGPMSAPVGDESRPKPVAIAGDLVLVSKLHTAETADTLSSPARPALIEPWLLPEPLLPVAIRATTRGEEEKLASALQRLVAEDVTLRLTHNAETHQIVLWTMGQAHVDKLLTSLKENWHVDVETEPVQMSFRETFIQPTVAQGRLVKQSGGHGQYAVCRLEIEPLERGAGIEFHDRVVGGAVPRHYIPSVEKGVRTQLEKGCWPAIQWSTSESLSSTEKPILLTPPTWPSKPPPPSPSAKPRTPPRWRCSNPSTPSTSPSPTTGSARPWPISAVGAARSTAPRCRSYPRPHRHPRRESGTRTLPLHDRPPIGDPRNGHLHPHVRPLRLLTRGARSGDHPLAPESCGTITAEHPYANDLRASSRTARPHNARARRQGRAATTRQE